MKKFFLVIALVMGALLFSSCQKDSKEDASWIIGTWKTSTTEEGETVDIYYTFNSDGTYVTKNGSISKTGTYVYNFDAHEVTLKISESSIIEVTVKFTVSFSGKDKMTVSNSSTGLAYTLTRQS